MPINKLLNLGLIWALTEKAHAEWLGLIQLGYDPDLAFAMIEENWPEDEIFDLPKDTNEVSGTFRKAN